MITQSAWISAALAFAVAFFGTGVLAQDAMPAKVDFLSGGVGLDEQEALVARGKEFNLKVVTAAERSGAYLAGVRLKVVGANGATVLDTPMDGPWLLAQLPAGAYVLEATFEGKTLTQQVAIPNRGQRQAHFYWRVPELFTLEREEEASPPSWMAPRAPKQ